eukprot:m.240382 g.240382  ORF g.240382 m.240382 type:complete len:264 (-) comp23335_c0_seq1:22-813(-)
MALGQTQNVHARTALKILVLGRANAGKTALVENFVDGISTQNKSSKPARVWGPSADVNMSFKDVVLADHPVRIELWDVAGSRLHSDMHRFYFQGACAALFVFDSTSKESFAEVLEWKRAFDELTAASPSRRLPALLVASKDDQWPHLPVVRDECSIADFCLQNGFRGWYSCSARTGRGIAAAVTALVASICWPGLSIPDLEELAQDAEPAATRARGQLFEETPLASPRVKLSSSTQSSTQSSPRTAHSPLTPAKDSKLRVCLA